MPQVETTELRNRNIMIAREVRFVGGSKLVMSSHYSLDALRIWAVGKRTLSWKLKSWHSGSGQNVLVSLFGMSQLRKIQCILS